MIEFCDRLKEAMTIRGITQSELCEKTGIPKSAMSQYISGAFKPKQQRTYLIAQALNVNEAWIMGYDVPMERAKNNAEQIYYDFIGINTLLSEFPTTDINVLNTGTINKAINKTMEINKMILSTPRLYVPCITIDDAVIGLKFLLAYYHINLMQCDDDALSRMIDSDLFRDFIKNMYFANKKEEETNESNTK